MQCVEELDNRFYIKESEQYNSGKGLFAKESIKSGSKLDIIGVVATSRECVEYTDGYNFVIEDGKCWVPLGYGALVNHASNPKDQNVDYEVVNGQPIYRFIKDVTENEEILANYGAGFANLLAVYLTLDQKEDFMKWQEDCEKIADSELGKNIYCTLLIEPSDFEEVTNGSL